jgi:hypothetical protein
LPIHTSRRAMHSSSSVLPSDGGGGDDWLRGNVGLHEPTCSSSQVMVRVTGSKDGMMAFSNTYMPIAMVDVHFVAASSHPSCREREAGGDYFPLQSRTVAMGGWPHRHHNSRAGEPAQCTAGMTASPLTTAGIGAVLLAAHQLLNNPSPSGASPSVAK